MRIRPVGEGNHNNIHFLITHGDTMKFKVVAFLDTCDAYVVSSKIKFNAKYLNLNAIHEELSTRLSAFDYNLKTPVENILTCFQNTEEVITQYKLYESIQYKNSI